MRKAVTEMDRYKASNLQAFEIKWPDCYDTSQWINFWVGRWDREVLAELPADISALRILDVGCATGRLLGSLAKAGARQLAGVDLAPRMLARAQQRLVEIGVMGDLKIADAEDSLSWSSESFDVVTMTGVLHHFYRPMDALEEVDRVLCSKGRLIVIDPWFMPPLRQLINLYLHFKPRNGDCRFYSPGEAIRLMALQGFTGFRQRRAVWHSFVVVGVKS